MSDDLLFDPFWVAEKAADSPPPKPAREQDRPSGARRPKPVPAKPILRVRRPRAPAIAPLEGTLLAKVRRVATRLNDAGHRAVVDERIGRRPAGARLLVEPSRGPLHPAAPSTVLELTVEGGQLGGRVWMDLMGPTPEAFHPLPGEDPEVWLDRVLLDFVSSALTRSRRSP